MEKNLLCKMFLMCASLKISQEHIRCFILVSRIINYDRICTQNSYSGVSSSRPVNTSFMSLNQCSKYSHMANEPYSKISSLGLTSPVIINELLSLSRPQFLH